MNWRNSLLTLALLGLLSCGGSSDPGPDSDPDPDPVPAPSATTLIFPENNTECNEGEVLNVNQSRVVFQWNSSQNTDSYEVNLRNLDTNNSSTTNANTNEAAIILERGTPYEWFVVSKANGTNETANSATWKFYNQGDGVVNYAPFPAEAVSPARGATINSTGTVSLEWNGSDVDGDIAEYEVYFGTEAEPSTLIDTLQDNTIDVNVTSGTVYYWRIITRDTAGNTSQSEVFDFRVN